MVETKACTFCNEVKPLTEFYRRTRSCDGHAWHCKKCSRIIKNERGYDAAYRIKHSEKLRAQQIANRGKYAATQRAYYEKNKERIKAQVAKYRAENPEKIRASLAATWIKRGHIYKPRAAKWRARNKDYLRIYQATHYETNKESMKRRIAEWKKANPEKVAQWDPRRRAAAKQATPRWAISFFMDEAYSLSQLRTKMLGYPWHVDHIVPLQSPIVCGLHCEQNMQVIPGAVNCRKHNNQWPDMPA